MPTDDNPAIHLEKQVRTLEAQQLALLEASTLPAALLNKGSHVYCNSRYAALFGRPGKASLCGTSLPGILGAQANAKLGEIVSGKFSGRLPVTLRCGGDMPARRLCLDFLPVLFRNRPCQQLTVRSDEGGRFDEQNFLDRLADPALFGTRVQAAIKAAVREHVTGIILVVRLADFDRIRARLGKESTNRIISEISDFLRVSINKPYTAARLSRHEFGLLLCESSPAEGLALADFIRMRLSAAPFPPKAALGLSVINAHARDAQTVIDAARANTGAGSTQAKTSSQRVRNALEGEGLILRFQPVIALHPDDTERFEVLLRLRGAGGTELLPDDFLPQAGIDNLAGRIDRAVLNSLYTGSALQPAHRQLHVHISGSSLSEPDLLAWLRNGRDRHGKCAGQLVCLVSEIDLHYRREAVLTFCSQARKLGLATAITRFGSTVDSLDVLEAVGPTWVRLDNTLIRDIPHSRRQRKSTGELVRTLHRQGTKVGVTGIESLELLPVLWELGMDFVQGDCLGPPSRSLQFAFPVEQRVTVSR